MAAINLKPFFEKLNQAINAGAQRLEKEAEEFGYAAIKENREKENGQAPDKE